MSSGFRSWCSAEAGVWVGTGELWAESAMDRATAPARANTAAIEFRIDPLLFGALYRARTVCAFITPRLKCPRARCFQPSQPLADGPCRVAGETTDRAAGSLRGEG